jgi:tetratricopeptide (TPR) repeat protein
MIIAFFFAHQLSYADYEKAIEYYKDAKYLKAEEELLSLPQSAKQFNFLGLIKNAMGDFKLSMDYYNRALEIANDSMALLIHFNRAICYNDYGYLESSIIEYETAAKLSLKLNDMRMYGKSLMGIGLCYYQQNKNDSAINYYERALEFNSTIEFKETIFTNIALINEDEEDFAGALEMHKKSLELHKSLEEDADVVNLSKSYSNIGLCYLKMDSIDEAGVYLDSAFCGIIGSHQYDFLSNFMNYYKVKKYEAKIDFIEKMVIYSLMTFAIILLSVVLVFARRKIRRRDTQIEKVRQLIASQM